MKYFSLFELSVAKDILATNGSVSTRIVSVVDDQVVYGDMIYPPEWVAWATDVINWYATLFRVAKLYCRYFLHDWQLSIKAVWQHVRHFKAAGDIAYLWRKVMRLIKGKQQSSRGRSWYANQNRVFSRSGEGKYAQKSRNEKYAQRQRCANIAESLQSSI